MSAPIEADKEYTVAGWGSVNRDTRRVPMHIVIDPPPDIGISQEEVFGPILPVHSYDSLDEAKKLVKLHDAQA